MTKVSQSPMEAKTFCRARPPPPPIFLPGLLPSGSSLFPSYGTKIPAFRQFRPLFPHVKHHQPLTCPRRPGPHRNKDTAVLGAWWFVAGLTSFTAPETGDESGLCHPLEPLPPGVLVTGGVLSATRESAPTASRTLSPLRRFAVWMCELGGREECNEQRQWAVPEPRRFPFAGWGGRLPINLLPV